jgi:N-acetylneuraminate lyase
MTDRLTGLIAATHTPFHADGSLNLDPVEMQAEHLLKSKVAGAFIGGTTGESSSLTVTERLSLAERWMSVVKGSSLQVIAHVGGNCLEDSRTLAGQAGKLGAHAHSAVAPSYFKPRDANLLVDFMAAIAGEAPNTPFYYYEIPTMTGLGVSPADFLAKAADRMPSLKGLKFTSSNLMEYQLCREFQSGRYDVVFGFDEMLLAALALGARGAVGSTYNFAAPVYNRLIAAFDRGDFAAARAEQFHSVRLVQTLVGFGFMGAAKATMEFLGVPVGPARLPNGSLSLEQKARLRQDLETIGFFDWIAD